MNFVKKAFGKSISNHFYVYMILKSFDLFCRLLGLEETQVGNEILEVLLFEVQKVENKKLLFGSADEFPFCLLFTKIQL